MSYWAVVVRRAFRESRKSVNIESIGAAVRHLLGQALLSGILLYFAPNSDITTLVVAGVAPFLTFPLLFVYYLPLIPPMLAKENEALAQELGRKSEDAVQKLSSENSSLTAEISRLKAPPPPPVRDPDGLYQLGRRVAKVVNPRVSRGESRVFFAKITSDGDFDQNNEFEYRDLVLQIERSNPGVRIGFETYGVTSQIHDVTDGVVCRILRAF